MRVERIQEPIRVLAEFTGGPAERNLIRFYLKSI